ncbi:serine/threonine protein phosphatase [Canna indica]|uniref:Serine/threonine protein phosphatase n=1 Tax=Canna indica TaxID=4628 RepID=A0AAQ3K2X0_9LILI|nr:serine/threonine protein phosphatase [Canna indica]
MYDCMSHYGKRVSKLKRILDPFGVPRKFSVHQNRAKDIDAKRPQCPHTDRPLAHCSRLSLGCRTLVHQRKPPKPESAAEPTSFPAGATSVSSVTVNHASRTTLSSYGAGAAPQIECLPLFRDVPVPERQALFLRKLQICAVVFDFSDTLKMIREKEVKRRTLSELVDFVQSGSGRLTEPVQEELVRTVGTNIFRYLPPASHENTGSEAADPEEEDPFLDPAWPHLQLVYELLLRYVISSDTDTKVAKRYFGSSLFSSLVRVCSSLFSPPNISNHIS